MARVADGKAEIWSGTQNPYPLRADIALLLGLAGYVTDDARRLSDEEFAEVLAFTKTAFDMAVRFRFAGSARARPAAKGRGE